MNYRRNEDKWGYCDAPVYNCVIDYTLSETGTPQSYSNATLQTVTFDTVLGETSIVAPELINATIHVLISKGAVYSEVPIDPITPVPPVDYEFTHDKETGTLQFDAGIPFIAGQKITVTFTGLVTYSLPIEPVTLAEAKNHLHISSTDDDAKLTELITQCRRSIENYCLISIVEKTVTAIINNSAGNIEFPWGPVKTMTSMHDVSNNEILVDNYTLRGLQFKKLVSPFSDYLTVVYTAGYVIVPQDLKLAILEEIAYQYEHRGEEEKASGICDAARVKAGSYSRRQIFV